MPSKAATAALAALIAAALLIGIIALWPAAAGAQAVTTGPVCGLSQRADQNADGTGVLSRPNPFNDSGQQFCIQPAAHHGPGFTVATNLRYTGNWQAFPYTAWGCQYDLCTPGARPIRLSKLPRSASASYSWRPGGATGIWNASFDIWFDKYGQTTTEDNGAELMIWLRTMPGYCPWPGRANCGEQLVRIGHRAYWFTNWRHCDPSHICFNYLQFRTTRTVAGVRRLWLRPFLTFLRPRKLVRPWWYLTSIHAGFELVSGGRGLQVTWFNAHV